MICYCQTARDQRQENSKSNKRKEGKKRVPIDLADFIAETLKAGVGWYIKSTEGKNCQKPILYKAVL